MLVINQLKWSEIAEGKESVILAVISFNSGWFVKSLKISLVWLFKFCRSVGNVAYFFVHMKIILCPSFLFFFQVMFRELNVNRFLCTLCYENEKDAIVECGHTYCATCLYRLEEEAKAERKEGKCPDCRRKLTFLNRFLFKHREIGVCVAHQSAD